MHEGRFDPKPDYQLGLHAQLACVWEATARKPGNVHRFRDFDDMGYLYFISSAAAMAPVVAVAAHYGVGATVCESVRMTKTVCGRNTNLGIALLLAPLAKARPTSAKPLPDYRGEVRRVLDEMDRCEGDADEECRFPDAGYVYYAIALANPGGLGDAPEQDVRKGPTAKLLDCMALAQARDLIARQYVNGFAELFDDVAPAVLAGIERTGCLEGGIIHAHLTTMAKHPDSLIGRKLGPEAARESAARAEAVLASGWPQTESGRKAIAELDDWLRGDGNRRNPGTTADLIAAGLFVLLRTHKVWPDRVTWSSFPASP
jgi:triphosphoribosyl-dephospho-CoA synthase